MLPILLAVHDVVDEIHDARQRAEDGEGANRSNDGSGVGETLPEEQAGEDEEILGPLARSYRHEQVRRR